MQQKINLQMLPSEAASDELLKKHLAQACGVKEERVTGYTIFKKIY